MENGCSTEIAGIALAIQLIQIELIFALVFRKGQSFSSRNVA